MKIINNKHDKNWRYSDEETFFDIVQRVEQLLEELTQRTEENILCVAHGTIIRYIIMRMILGDEYTPAIYEKIKNTMKKENTGITLCEFDENGWQLLTWNDYAHLG